MLSLSKLEENIIYLYVFSFWKHLLEGLMLELTLICLIVCISNLVHLKYHESHFSVCVCACVCYFI